MNPNGRPREHINLDELEKLCGLQCTQPDIAGWFNVSLATIERRVQSTELLEYHGEQLTFKDIMDRGYAKGRVSLRRRQMEGADKGNPTMLIWLGKQILGQRDKIDTAVSTPEGIQVEHGFSPAHAELLSRINGVAARIGTPEADKESSS